MVMSLKEQILGTLDPKVVYLCIAVLVVLLIITIVKKFAVAAIIVVLVGVGMYSLVPAALDFQENYSISREDGIVTIRVDGKEFQFGNSIKNADKDIPAIKQATLTRQSDGTYTLKIFYVDGGVGTFNVPGYMRSALNKYLESMVTNYKLTE